MALDFRPNSFNDNLLFVWKILYSRAMPINQTLSDGFGQANIRALAIGHFPAIVAMVKLREIQRQMLRADMVERADHTAL